MTNCELELELEENYTNMLRQRLAEKSLFRKHGDSLYNIIFGQLYPDVIAAVKNSTKPLYATVHSERDVVALLSILLSVCVKNLSGRKVDPLYNGLQIISSTLSYSQKQRISNSDFGDAVLDQVLATTSQCGVFTFRERYHEKVLSDDGLDLPDYFALTKVEKESYDGKACDLVSSRIIIQNSTSSRTRTYLKEQCYVNQSNYPNTVVATIALITSF